MNTEFELKILEIDIDSIISKLNSLGAKNLGEKNLRRFVYDMIPKKENSWLRLRTDGKKTTLTVKEIINAGIDGTKELEIAVDNFDTTHRLLEKLGFKPKAYQENKRKSFILNNTEIEIDFWPKIPTYLEIEGRSVEEVQKMVIILGFEQFQTTSMSVTEVYKKYGLDIDSFKELKF
jgi:adenylate cyclase class 2